MSDHTDLDIIALAEGFRACSVPKEKWTHAAHWAAALYFLAEDENAAFRDFPTMIRTYNLSVGGQNTDTDGYHETITLASLRAAADTLSRAPEGRPLAATLTALLAGPCGSPDWILEYWSRETLFSVKARREWVEPDIRPLPF